MTRTQTVQQITDNLRARRDTCNAKITKAFEAVHAKMKPFTDEITEIDRVLAAMTASEPVPAATAAPVAGQMPAFLGKHKPSDNERELLAES